MKRIDTDARVLLDRLKAAKDREEKKQALIDYFDMGDVLAELTAKLRAKRAP